MRDRRIPDRAGRRGLRSPGRRRDLGRGDAREVVRRRARGPSAGPDERRPGFERRGGRSGGTRRTRARETEAAARVLGLSSVGILDVHDGELENTAAVREHVVRAIRRIRPSAIGLLRPHGVVLREPLLQPLGPSDRRRGRARRRVPRRRQPATSSPTSSRRGSRRIPSPTSGSDGRSSPTTTRTSRGSSRPSSRPSPNTRSQVEGDLLGFFEEWIPKEAEEAGRAIGVSHAESFRRLDLS